MRFAQCQGSAVVTALGAIAQKLPLSLGHHFAAAFYFEVELRSVDRGALLLQRQFVVTWVDAQESLTRFEPAARGQLTALPHDATADLWS